VREVPASFDDVAAMAADLPEVVEGERHGRRTWFVGKKGFAWERPLTKADLKRLGDEPAPQGDLLGLLTDDLADKEAVLAAGTPGVFTISHFDGYPAVLVQLRVVGKRALRELLTDAWLAAASDAQAEAFLASSRRRR
jgi:hypothetical protein